MKDTPILEKIRGGGYSRLVVALFLQSGEVEVLRQKGSLLTVLILSVNLLD